ncbi:MAG: Ig-like domain-containing protein, partial [Promethearchaeota archaeon]
MKILIKRRIFVISIIAVILFPGYFFIYNELVSYNGIYGNEIHKIVSQAVNPTGKVFSNMTHYNPDCYINKENPNQNIQPSIYIPDYNISHAKMYFENIRAINYTKDIELNPTEITYSSENEPMYIFQKFYVAVNRYVNNVSIFIQDIINLYNYSEANSWEVAIVNCKDDGIPNNETLGELVKPHPLNFAAHWEVFDFMHSATGPIFLNKSKTYHTLENGIDKYWFAFRIKIPPDDTRYGGGPKFLYFNPDGDDMDSNGEGDTFLYYNKVFIENFTVNYVKELTNIINGINTKGNLISFREFDEDRYNCVPTSNNLTLDTKFYIRNVTSGILNETVVNFFAAFPGLWRLFHLAFLNSIDFYLVTNITNSININNAAVLLKNYTNGAWVDFSNRIDINHENETILSYKISDPDEKLGILKSFINYTNHNSMEFRFQYNGTGNFEISYNLFTINFGERLQINNTILPYDPLIQELVYPSEINENALNGTIISENNLDLLKLNDDKFFEAQADINNLSLEFKFNILPDIKSSFWDVDLFDWEDILSPPIYPYPYMPQIDFRISSNVSINTQDDLELAIIEIYKGNRNYTFLTPEENELEWLQLSETNKSLANKFETTQEDVLNSLYTWVALQLINSSDENSVRMRLRYLGSSGFERFNVSVDEFTLNLYIQNIKSSDITSKIGFGIKNSELRPSDIVLKNFGTDVQDIGFGRGYWEGDIDFGEPIQGFFDFNVSCLWNFLTFDVNGTYEVYKVRIFLEFFEFPVNQYMIGNQLFSAKATTAGGKPIENLNIIFELLDTNSVVRTEATAITNNEGIASANLQFSETGDGFSVRLRFIGPGIYTGNETISGLIRIVDDFILFMDTFYMLLPYILGILAAVFIFIGVRHQRHKKLQRIWAKEAMILDDLINISYIMIIHKDVGVSIFNKQISLEVIDSDLVSGFLQAISQFGKEIVKKPNG